MEGGKAILSISRSPFRPFSPVPQTTIHLRHYSRSPLSAVSPLHTTSSTLPEPLKQIHKAGIVACLRAQNVKTAVEAAHAALAGGVSVLEIVITTPGALEIIKVLCKDYPSVKFGIGTVLNIEDARKLTKAGAQFLMSPCTVMEILHWFRGSEILYIPGVMTPTEIFSAYNAGAEVVKVYPVSALGGEKYISTLRKPFPTIPMIASQGITTGSVGKYINAGASAVVLSDAIFDKEAMIKEDFDEIKRLAHLVTIEASLARKGNSKL
ncbi:KHG/KDPG aldolase [Carex littledalei]|uniref:KHG/KDPG aldolase n=1 Tax=Carex littledalei TaxID=544730 RepID=A0A833RIN3_9POAL|nr:KHG/KDPG aldolase [Carex littledalei]